jgi:hypothetical protein
MVYCQVYGANQDDVEFLLVPMPRLEIETIQDFKILHEIGALSPDMTVKLSRILLGEEPGAARKTPAQQQQQLSAAEPFPEKNAGNPSSDKNTGNNSSQPSDKKTAGAKPPSKS